MKGAALAALAVVVLAYAAPVLAQVAQQPANRLDEVVRQFRQAASGWEGPLTSIAKRLFGLLILIEVTWTFITLALKGADFSEFVAELVNRVFYIGFFWFLINNASTLCGQIVDSFRQAGAAATGGGEALLHPSAIFASGVELAGRIWDGMSALEVGTAIGLAVGGLIVLIVFALLGAFVILALVESYIVVSAGVLMMGFGGSRWTKEYAIKIVQYAMSVGAKLFVLELILGLGQRMVLEWTNRFPDVDNVQRTDVFVMVGMAIVLLALSKQVPDTVQALINGTHVGSGSAILGAAAAVSGGAAAVAGAITGSGSAVGGAFKLAREQIASGEAQQGTLGRTAMKNLAGAAMKDVGDRLSGKAHHGHMPWRMSAGLTSEAEQMKERRLSAEKTKEEQAASAGQTRPAAAGAGAEGGARNVLRPVNGEKKAAGAAPARRTFKRS